MASTNTTNSSSANPMESVTNLFAGTVDSVKKGTSSATDWVSEKGTSIAEKAKDTVSLEKAQDAVKSTGSKVKEAVRYDNAKSYVSDAFDKAKGTFRDLRGSVGDTLGDKPSIEVATNAAKRKNNCKTCGVVWAVVGVSILAAVCAAGYVVYTKRKEEKKG